MSRRRCGIKGEVRDARQWKAGLDRTMPALRDPRSEAVQSGQHGHLDRLQPVRWVRALWRAWPRPAMELARLLFACGPGGQVPP